MAWQLDLMAFLWLNVLGCLLVVVIAILLQFALSKKQSV
jgi:membrane protein DedA with SNARE-associated domain